ncbi:MAG: hypothetical protein R3Y43_03400 [Alphaproteobacteria bacterium]
MSISIKGLNKVFAFKALYDGANQLGLGFLNPLGAAGTGMSIADAIIEVEEAKKYSYRGQISFDYVNGRVMKVDIGKDEFDPWLYDRDNGEGAAAKAIEYAYKMAPEWEKELPSE